MQLRPYQDCAVNAVFDYVTDNDGSPLVVCPTGSGKSVICAELVNRIVDSAPSEMILVLSHRKEILSQNAAKLQKLLPPSIRVGVFSAGLGKKQIRQVTVAGIQSIYRVPQLPPFGTVIVDEAHLIPKSGDGMYLKLLARLRAANPGLRLVGLTATPFRTDGGFLHDGDERIFDDICYEISVRELIEAGHLATLVTKHTEAQADLTGVHTRGGEFVASEAEAAVDTDTLVRAAVAEMVRYGADRKSWLIFCAGIKHALHVHGVLKENGVTSKCLFGDTPLGERDFMLSEFKTQRLRAIVSVDCLTTGFDAPCVDLIGMLRPTKSTGLWIQALGRGMRPSPETGKQNCLVLDFCNSVARCGTVDNPIVRGGAAKESDEKERDEEKGPPVKVCPECRSCVHPTTPSCPDCGYEWPELPPKHASVASSAPLLSKAAESFTKPVTRVSYRRHEKHGSPNSLLAVYKLADGGKVSEWVFFEHSEGPRKKAERWWRLHARRGGGQPPETVTEALERLSELRNPRAIITVPEKNFTRVAAVLFDEDGLVRVETPGELELAGI